MIGDLRGRLLFATLILVVGVILAGPGCGDDDDNGPTGPPATFDPPSNLLAVNGDGEITLTWAASPHEGQGEFRRYNLYRATSSLVGVEPSQLPTPIAFTNPGVRTIGTPVTNGTLYYYHVRGERTNGDLTAASNEISAAGRPEGAGKVINEFKATGDSGFDFSEGLSVSLSQANTDRFEKTDLYLGTSAVSDSSSGELRLKSPHLLGVAGYRAVGIKILGTEWGVSTTTDDGWTDQVAVVKDLVYAVRIPATGTPANFAKLQITAVKSTPAGERNVTLKYAYQPGADLALF